MIIKVGVFLDEANVVWGQLRSLLLNDGVYISCRWIDIVQGIIGLVLLVQYIGLFYDGQASEVGHGS